MIISYEYKKNASGFSRSDKIASVQRLTSSLNVTGLNKITGE